MDSFKNFESKSAGVIHIFSFVPQNILVQLFSCEICEIFKNTFFYRTPVVATSDMTSTINNFTKTNASEKSYIQSMVMKNNLNPLTTNVSHHTETNQLICNTNHLNGFYMMGDIGR